MTNPWSISWRRTSLHQCRSRPSIWSLSDSTRSFFFDTEAIIVLELDTKCFWKEEETNFSTSTFLKKRIQTNTFMIDKFKEKLLSMEQKLALKKNSLNGRFWKLRFSKLLESCVETASHCRLFLASVPRPRLVLLFRNVLQRKHFLRHVPSVFLYSGFTNRESCRQSLQRRFGLGMKLELEISVQNVQKTTPPRQHIINSTSYRLTVFSKLFSQTWAAQCGEYVGEFHKIPAVGFEWSMLLRGHVRAIWS